MKAARPFRRARHAPRSTHRPSPRRPLPALGTLGRSFPPVQETSAPQRDNEDPSVVRHCHATPRRTLCSGGTVKKPSLRIHFRRICSEAGSGSPMPSAVPAPSVRRRRRRRRRDFSAQARCLLPGRSLSGNGYRGNRSGRGPQWVRGAATAEVLAVFYRKHGISPERPLRNGSRRRGRGSCALKLSRSPGGRPEATESAGVGGARGHGARRAARRGVDGQNWPAVAVAVLWDEGAPDSCAVSTRSVRSRSALVASTL